MSGAGEIPRTQPNVLWSAVPDGTAAVQGCGGYHGRYLIIDLTRGAVQVCTLGQEELRRVVGGAGLGVYLLLRHNPPDVDPLASDSCLVIAFSPLVGSPFTTTAKFAIAAKSPLTERCCDSLCSSAFALAGKRTGFDALVIKGVADQPCVLVVSDREVHALAAPELWGTTVSACDRHLAARYPGREWVTIGPAGERLVRFATIQHDGRHAGRGGLGAVMGSKRLKAVVVSGNCFTRIAEPESAGRLARELAARSLGPATAKYRLLGTVANVAFLRRVGALPERNFRSAGVEPLEHFSGEDLLGEQRVARKSCAACTIGCEHRFRTAGGEARVEYETIYALAAACGRQDLDEVLEAARLCDELGLDTISTGVTIGFALECVERGWLRLPEMAGHVRGALPGWVEAIGLKMGDLGELLGEGVRRLAARLGPEAENIAPHVKGLELPGYEPRAMPMMGLGLAVTARGADHNRTSGYEVDLSPGHDRLAPGFEQVAALVEQENRAALMDSLILCKFLRRALTDFYADCAAMLRTVTGWDVTSGELREVAERVVTLRRLFNTREGADCSEDTLPDRFFREPLSGGPAAGAVLDRSRFYRLRAHYYALRGWSPDGLVRLDTLQRLSLLPFAEAVGAVCTRAQ